MFRYVVKSERGSACSSCLRRAASGSTLVSRGSTTLSAAAITSAFAQRAVAVRDDEQPRDARIDRQARHELAVVREPALGVDRAEKIKELIRVAHGLRRRRVDERELLDGPEPQRLEPQQHAREPRAQDLGLRELGPLGEILLA